MIRSTCLALCGAAVTAFVACSKSPTGSGAGPGAGAANDHADHDDHVHDDAHAHANGDADDHGHGHGGSVIELGTMTIGLFTVRATRDAGEVRPGGDVAIDAWVTLGNGGGSGAGAAGHVRAVRLWIGLDTAAGSVKARAEIEDPAAPDRWHTHAEVPSPLPPGSQLWVEIESDDGAKHAAPFKLVG
jgi:hypothetical protein